MLVESKFLQEVQHIGRCTGCGLCVAASSINPDTGADLAYAAVLACRKPGEFDAQKRRLYLKFLEQGIRRIYLGLQGFGHIPVIGSEDYPLRRILCGTPGKPLFDYDRWMAAVIKCGHAVDYREFSHANPGPGRDISLNPAGGLHTHIGPGHKAVVGECK